MSEPVGVLVAAAGAGLVYAALTGQNPVTELRSALSTGSTDGRPAPNPDGFGAGVLARIRSLAPSGPGTDGTSSPAESVGGELVPIGQGGHRLASSAATAFANWQRAYGQAIPITDSVRSAEQQRAAYERDPRRFADPAKSKHVRGEAVDVNLSRLGISVGPDPRRWMESAKFRKLAETARAAGWCNYQLQNGSTGGKVPEPWHFPYVGCG